MHSNLHVFPFVGPELDLGKNSRGKLFICELPVSRLPAVEVTVGSWN
jgi:hypothetical protein